MRYEVTIRDCEIYIVEVEADSEDEAENAAWELITESEKNRQLYHYDSDGDSEAIEIND